jgi:hypothetical protein
MLRRAVVVLLGCGLLAPASSSGQSQPVPAAGPGPAQIVLRDGTSIHLSLATPLSSKTAKAGDEVKFEVVAPVMVEGLVVIPRGATVAGKVATSRRPGRLGRPGDLSVSVERLYLDDSTIVSLRGRSQSVKGMGGNVDYPAGVSGFDNLLVMPAFVVLSILQTGGDAAAPVGTLVSGYVDGDMVLDRESVRRLQVPDRAAHVFIYFPMDRFTKFACPNCSKTRKNGDPNAQPRVTKPIFLGTVEVTRLTFEAYARLDLPPGSYWVHSSGNKDFRADLTVAKSYYLRMTQSGFGKGNLELVAEEKAQSEMAAATREVPVHIPANDPHLLDKTEPPKDDTEPQQEMQP